MITTLKSRPHTFRGQPACEIWRGGKLIGTIYPSARGVTIESKLLPLALRPETAELLLDGHTQKLAINILPDPRQ